MKKESVKWKLARHYGVTIRTVNAWMKAGAPIPDSLGKSGLKKLGDWLASRRQTPKFTPPPAGPSKRVTVPLVLGLAASLKRQEQQEAADYQAVLDAVESGDKLSERMARDTWHRSSEQLRRTD